MTEKEKGINTKLPMCIYVVMDDNQIGDSDCPPDDTLKVILSRLRLKRVRRLDKTKKMELDKEAHAGDQSRALAFGYYEVDETIKQREWTHSDWSLNRIRSYELNGAVYIHANMFHTIEDSDEDRDGDDDDSQDEEDITSSSVLTTAVSAASTSNVIAVGGKRKVDDRDEEANDQPESKRHALAPLDLDAKPLPS
jgi:hypothetical protein